MREREWAERRIGSHLATGSAARSTATIEAGR